MTTTLSQALDTVSDVARQAGIDPETVRTEAAQLAAAVAESSPNAYKAWAEQLGVPANAESFFTEASRGRKFRAAPTPALQELARTGSPQLKDLAKALVDVCLAAATLGEPSTSATGAAQLAATSQMTALGIPAAGNAAPVTPGSRDEQEFLSAAPGILRDVLARMDENNKRLLDLRNFDPLSPGAIPGLPGSTPQPGTPVVPGQAGEPAQPVQAAAPDPAPAEDKKPEPPPKTLEELLAELDGLIGLASVKDEIHRQAAILKVEGMRAKAGLKSPTITRHLVFVGNPGTGKTTVARLVGGIYRALGLLSKGQLIEVDRSELVAGYLGQTALKTAEVVAKAEGGVLFIDEAYALNGDQYGEEAINTLVKEMEDKRDNLVVIVAGYTQPMAVFISENPGLASRFRTTIEFPDYTDDELVAIFKDMAKKSDYALADGTEAAFRKLLSFQIRDETFGNGRFARNVFEAAVGRHAWRLKDATEPSVDDLKLLLPGDIALSDEPTVNWPPAAAVPDAEKTPDLPEAPAAGPPEAEPAPAEPEEHA